MATLQHNITTVLTQDLLAVGEDINNVKYISIANVDLDSAIVSLFLNKGDNNYYLIKGHRLTPGSTLYLRAQIQDDSGAAVSVDIIITR